jgi:hypothetical protein
VDVINNKIDDNIKKLTFGSYHSLCMRVSTSLPRELKDNIYKYLYSGKIEFGFLDIISTMDMLLLRGWVQRNPRASPFPTMRLCLGDEFAH